MMPNGPRSLPIICCHPVTYYSNSEALCTLLLLVLQGRGRWQGNSVRSVVLSTVGVLLQRCPVYVRARNLSVVWAGSVHWLKSVSYPQGWHRPVSGLLFLWIPSWPTSDSPQSNMMDHLLHLPSGRTEKKMDGKDSAMTGKAHPSNNAIIPCESIWSQTNTFWIQSFLWASH